MTDDAIHPIDAPPAADAAPSPLPPTPPLRAIDIVRRRSRLARRSTVVPEWEDMKCWFGRLTVGDMEATGAREAKTTLERNLILLILKAENEDGTPVFAQGDLHFLKTEADFLIVQRLLDFMFATVAQLPPVEEEADRIAANPPSASA